MAYSPPFQITINMVNQVALISELLGSWSATTNAALSPQLRRQNRIRTIQASLAIENNTLTVEQVTEVLDGKRVLGLPREIREVRNSFAAYEKMEQWSPTSINDLLSAHGFLMAGLVDRPGQIRAGGVGIFRGETLIHMAPPAKRVSGLLADLLAWLAQTKVQPLIASCVIHYELEFIHPFEDGNGRMGRLWQTLILSKWQPILGYLPVETVIHDQQDAYYEALAKADDAAEATPFAEFMLEALHLSMTQILDSKGSEKSSEEGSEKTSGKIIELLQTEPFLSAKDLAAKLKLSARAVEKQIAKLREAGKLKRVGPPKGGHWEVY